MRKRKGFGQKISGIGLTRDSVELNDAAKGQVTDKFCSAKDVFSLFEGHRIDGEVDNPFVIGGENGGSLGGVAEIGEKFTEEEYFLRGSAHCEIFGFGTGH